MKYDYTKKNISKTLDIIGIKKGDLIYCHSNLGFFGKTRIKNIPKVFFETLKTKSR